MYQDVQRPEVIPGIKFWQNEKNKFHIVMCHYTADPAKNPATEEGAKWYENERASMPLAKWNKEYEIDFSTKSGKLVFGKDFCDFDEGVHFIKSFEVKGEYLLALDFGQRNPTAALVAVYTDDGKVYIIDEYYEPAIPSVSSKKMFRKFAPYISECNPGERITSENITEKYTFTQRRDLADRTFQIKVIDPTTRSKNRTKYIDGEEEPYSVIEEFYDNGWDFEPAINDFDAGITRIREYLTIGENNDSNFYVFIDKCPNLVKEWKKFRYKSMSEKMSRENNDSERPVKKDDHALDACRYLIMTRPIHPEKPQRQLNKIERDLQRLTAPKNLDILWDSESY